MTSGAVKLQDFARDLGVTDRNIQKHIQHHRADLEGHIERRGNNGTWLDEYAQNYIRDLVRPAPVVYAAGAAEELDKLRQELETVNAKYAAALESLLVVKQQLADNQATTLRLEAATDEITRLRSELDQTKDALDQTTMAREIADHDLAAANQRIAALTQRTLWQRVFRRGE